jgi:3-dehydroquinate synthase
MNDLAIRSSQGVYPARFLPDLAALAREMAAVPRALLIIDRKVARAYPDFTAALAAAMPVREVDATEDEKTLEGCARVLTFLQENNATRQTNLLAVGGGIVQDIATLCAHLYYRGIAWHYYPTTLLGMADSCIGAKASINFNQYKNQLGVFHSPVGVGLCTRFLDSLPETELRSGWGEIVKLHLAGSAGHFASVAAALREGGWRTPRLAELVHASLRVKQAVIEVDEFDQGIRRTLNYGHTFGHALEAITRHAIPHGLAIAWGMDLINFLAVRRGVLAEADHAAIHALLREFFAWRLPAPVTAAQLLDATRRDKKVQDGRLNLALLRRPGELFMAPQAYDDALAADLAEYLARHSIVTW